MGRRNFLDFESNAVTDVAPAPLGMHGAHHAAAPLPARTVLSWNQLALQTLHHTPSGAPLAASVLARLHTALYNAWAAYDDDARQTEHGIAVRLPRAERTVANKVHAMRHAAWRVLHACLPAHGVERDLRAAGVHADPADTAGLLTSAGIGRLQAAALIERSPILDTAADDPPAIAMPCHWYRLARYVSERDGHEDDQDVLLYFVLTNALADAADAARTRTCGQLLGQGACAAAAAEVLRSFTGSDRLGPGPSARRCGAPVFEPGWTTFSEAAEQTHLASGIGVMAEYAAGMALGRQIGAMAFDSARRHWHG